MKCISPFICILLLAVCINTTAQTSAKEKQLQPVIRNWWWLQVNPLTILEPEVPISATIQYNPNSSWGIALDGGVFVARQSYDEKGFYKYGGFRLKPQVKYYFDIRKRNKVGFYLSLQGLIKRTTRDREEWFSRGVSNGQPLFNQLINYKERKVVLGGHFITGLEFTPGAPKKWMIEIYLGLGLRNKTFRADNLPADITIDYDTDRNDNVDAIFDIYQNGTVPSVAAGFKIGYRIK